jgi:hypothetical protein
MKADGFGIVQSRPEIGSVRILCNVHYGSCRRVARGTTVLIDYPPIATLLVTMLSIRRNVWRIVVIEKAQLDHLPVPLMMLGIGLRASFIVIVKKPVL